MASRIKLSEYRYGIREVRADGVGPGIVFARFMFSDDRDNALRAIRSRESEYVANFTRLVPVRFRPKGVK